MGVPVTGMHAIGILDTHASYRRVLYRCYRHFIVFYFKGVNLTGVHLGDVPFLSVHRIGVYVMGAILYACEVHACLRGMYAPAYMRCTSARYTPPWSHVWE